MPVHLGKLEMSRGGWTGAVDSTKTYLAAAIRRIKDLAAAPRRLGVTPLRASRAV